MFRKIDKDTLEIKVPTFAELLEVEESPDFVHKSQKQILKQARDRFGTQSDLPPGVYQFNVSEIPAYEIQWIPSPHYNRRPSARIDMLILHYTVTSSLENTVSWFQNPTAKVSAHYVVGKGGQIVQMVRDEHRAWHAGVSNWNGEPDCNDYAIGVEIVNEGEKKGIPYTPRQYEALIYLCDLLVNRYAIPQFRVLGHSDISPDRKIDPGRHFNWKLLAENSIGFFPTPIASAGSPFYGGFELRFGDNDRSGIYGGKPTASSDYVRTLQADLRKIGYYITMDGDFGPKTKAVVEAFQRHYRYADISGSVDQETAGIIKAFFAV